jgi:hypothetical protein
MADVRQPRITTMKRPSLTGGTPLELLTVTIVRVNSQTLRYKTAEKSSFRFRGTKTASFSRTV